MILSHGGKLEERDHFSQTALIIAARTRNFDIVKYLVEKGANINVQTSSGESPLSIVKANGHKGIADFLIKSGAKK